MQETAEDRPGFRQRQAAVEQFVGALVKSARTVALYHAGHPLIPQITARVRELLLQAVGQEPNLGLELKAKTVLLEETPLSATPETLAFAATLHTLGVGQVAFTSRITPEGLLEFMGVLNAKPDEKRKLADIQKAVQDVRIDGLQMVFILSFVVTGEQEESGIKPGALDESQIAAFTAAPTLPDFLHLLLLQSEPLSGKEAEAVVTALDKVLHGELTAEEFEDAMLWDLYDPRIRGRWDALRADVRARTRWTRDALVSSLALLDLGDRESLRAQGHHSPKAAFGYAVDDVRAILSAPAGEKQPKYALYAYARLLADMGRAGDLDRLLEEYELWLRAAGDAKWTAYLAALKKDITERVPTPALAEALAARLAGLDPGSPDAERLKGFSLILGPRTVPLLLDELRKGPERTARERLVRFLTLLCRTLGADALVLALSDEDYFLVVQVLGILAELALPDTARHAAPLLRHGHPKVRAAAVRTLGRFGGAQAAEALHAFISSGEHPDEVRLAVTAVSLLQEPGTASKLIEAFGRSGDYETNVSIAMVLGRLPGAESRAFLEAQARRTWLEWLTGRNKALRDAARSSLDTLRSGGPRGA